MSAEPPRPPTRPFSVTPLQEPGTNRSLRGLWLSFSEPTPAHHHLENLFILEPGAGLLAVEFSNGHSNMQP